LISAAGTASQRQVRRGGRAGQLIDEAKTETAADRAGHAETRDQMSGAYDLGYREGPHEADPLGPQTIDKLNRRWTR
jgi:hypothetical protein